MRSVSDTLLFASASGPSLGPVERVTGLTANASNTSTTLSGIQSGDLILLTSTGGTHPSPAGFTILETWAAGWDNNVTIRQQWRTSTSTSLTLSAWGGGAQGEQARFTVFRKAAIGAFAVSAVGVKQFPALTLTKTDGSSWVFCVAGLGSTWGFDIQPVGYTREVTLLGASLSHSGSGVTARTAEAFDAFGNTRGSSLEIKAA